MKILFYLLIVLLFVSCSKNSKISNLESPKCSIEDLVKVIEKQEILFNIHLHQYGIFTRDITYVLLVLEEEPSYCFFTKKYNNNSLEISFPKDYTSKDKEKLTNIGDSLFKIFKNNKILQFYLMFHSPKITDSTLFIITTALYDSTYDELKKADTNFYDYTLDLSDSTRVNSGYYFYTLIHSKIDPTNIEEFIRLKKYHQIQKIKKNWYFYRSYEYDYRINFENYFEYFK